MLARQLVIAAAICHFLCGVDGRALHATSDVVVTHHNLPRIDPIAPRPKVNPKDPEFVPGESSGSNVAAAGVGTATRQGDFNGQVVWTDMLSKDGIKENSDRDGISYMRDYVKAIINHVAAQDRTAVFWSDIGKPDMIQSFIDKNLDGHGTCFSEAYDDETWDNVFEAGRPESIEYRGVYRMSKALAASARNDRAYLVMDRLDGDRTIFSPASKVPMDADPKNNGRPTLGEIWAYVELPMLMRNLNIKQIYSVWQKTPMDDWVEFLEWDVDRDMASKPRNFRPEWAMDVEPIQIPGRIFKRML